ncbi:hypothetical protein K438DRAFT_1798313 [Mycena galopus ATCC 62051]|nr:hypothetical protein K438DRAFT_1798313 [Mycena galopus ATCC 62051]
MSSPRGQDQRTENTSIIRSETWRHDGNVVLQAANTQFRVHWSLLALHSSVFRDMEGLPQPPGQPSVEGCPILELFDDPDDVEYLLKALYIPEFHCQRKLPFSAISAFVRLGRKYDFKYLFDSAVARLISEFPATLEEFDAINVDSDFSTIESCPGIFFSIIALLSQDNILSALPSAYFFAVISNSLAGLFDGDAKEDGTRVFLPPVDFRRCCIGQQRLLIEQFQPGYTYGWILERQSEDCTNALRCREAREALAALYLKNPMVVRILETPKSQERFLKSKFCSGCVRHAAESMATGRKKTWEELPGFFDLPPWSELRNDI